MVERINNFILDSISTLIAHENLEKYLCGELAATAVVTESDS
jgi:hypothetical protein